MSWARHRCEREVVERDLFGSSAEEPSPPPLEPASPIIGLRVRLPRVCQCGDNLAVIGSSCGPHAASRRCGVCNGHRGWLAHRQADWPITITRKFGSPTTPLVLRGFESGGCS
jgi:hypothetical protein